MQVACCIELGTADAGLTVSSNLTFEQVSDVANVGSFRFDGDVLRAGFYRLSIVIWGLNTSKDDYVCAGASSGVKRI